MSMIDQARTGRVNAQGDGGIGWDGRRLDSMLDEFESQFAETGHCFGLREMPLKDADPLHFEKIFSRVRGGIVSARETALNISASPIVRELGEICFALYTPTGDNVALSTGIIVHVHTMSEAVKYMARHGWEDNPGIRPGDIFANNQPTIGDVHNADVQTFVPIFNPEDPAELLGWAGGVIHVMDIGASTPGGIPIGPVTRFEDGIDFHCMKIGEKDTLAQWHTKRVSMQSRAPGLYLLDEKTRLAGCHMIRSAVERIVADEGAEVFKQFMREAIEDGRRAFHSRVRSVLVPGRYRSPAFIDIEFADRETMPRRARRDMIVHTAYEAQVRGDGHWITDVGGSSAWGWHAFNATPSGCQGMQWIQFTQGLICNDRINDGAYYATTLRLTPGSWCDLGDAPASSSFPWNGLLSGWTGYGRCLARGLFARGYVEEVSAPYNVPGNTMQGGGLDQYGAFSGFTSFETAAMGMGGKYVLDGLDYGAAVFNPEGDMGDVEMWELVAPLIYLSRRVDPASAGIGRHRGGSGQTSLIMFWNTPDYEAEHISAGKMFPTSGIFGGYPAPTGYVHDVFDSDLLERAARGEAYPVEEPDRGASLLQELGGRHERTQRTYTLMQHFKQGDLYLSTLKGGPGVGDPLLRPVERVRADIEGDHLLERFAESAYAISDRDHARRRRLERSRPTAEWWAEQRERLLAQELIEPVKVMLAESMRLSPEWAAEFRGFWDLPEAFDFDVVCPTVAIERAAPGKVSPQQAASAFLAQSGEQPVVRAESDVPSAVRVPKGLLADLVDEKLSRRAIRELQSGHKDPARFDTWVALLQERVEWGDPIVLPLGERLYIVKRASDRDYVIRTHAGADLCGAHENWKMHAMIYVRDSDEALREIYPDLGYPDPAWQELREFYCPLSGDLLEVDATPPGYPVVHDFLPDLGTFYEGWLGRALP